MSHTESRIDSDHFAKEPTPKVIQSRIGQVVVILIAYFAYFIISCMGHYVLPENIY